MKLEMFYQITDLNTKITLVRAEVQFKV